MANTQKNKVKLEAMTKEQRKTYNLEMAEKRKEPEFFKDTAEKRTGKAIKALRTVGFMGKYNGTDKQRNAITEAINAAVTEMNQALYKKSKKKESFKL